MMQHNLFCVEIQALLEGRHLGGGFFSVFLFGFRAKVSSRRPCRASLDLPIDAKQTDNVGHDSGSCLFVKWHEGIAHRLENLKLISRFIHDASGGPTLIHCMHVGLSEDPLN